MDFRLSPAEHRALEDFFRQYEGVGGEAHVWVQGGAPVLLEDIHMRKSGLAVISVTCLVLGSGVAAQPIPEQSAEGPFDLRALGKRRGNESESAAAAASALREVAGPGLVFDEEGRSNELIIRLGYSDQGGTLGLLSAGRALTGASHRIAVEEALLAAVQRRDRGIGSALGNPVSARPLIQHSRLDPRERDDMAPGSAREQLEQDLVLRYPSVKAALVARERLKKDPAIRSVTHSMKANFSWSPNDPYFQLHAVFGPSPEAVPTYQWGIRAMNFPLAWDRSQGLGYVGIIDGGYPGVLTKPAGASDYQFVQLGVVLHDDVKNNYRRQFDTGPFISRFIDDRGPAWHATHVAGIIAASGNNGQGVTGGCPSCSLATYRLTDTATFLSSAKLAAETGMQVLNWSGELGGDDLHTLFNCSNEPDVCAVMQLLKERDILLVQASGNFRRDRPPFPSNLPASTTSALPVGGTQIREPMITTEWGMRSGSLWNFNAENGSSLPGLDGVLGPAKSIVSTVPRYSPAWDYINWPQYMCGDSYARVNGVVVGADESGSRFPSGSGDGYGSCTGTSMAAPHITALAGLVRSINPLLSASSVRTIIQNSGNQSGTRTQELGAGLPNALTAVNAAIATNPKRLTPLFSFYSADRLDSFYTTIPQMASAAILGTLKPFVACTAGMTNCIASPKYGSGYGSAITAYGASGGAYSSFPGVSGAVFGGSPPRTPMAQVWVFTTHENPKVPSVPLVPLYRLSWKCDDAPVDQRPAICMSNPSHTDTTYTADPAGVDAYVGVGYKLDGIEGYLYPKTIAQPAGTVRLMRKYNPTRDDHAIFPETALSTMIMQGYTQDSGSDWLGYVYPNTGPVPVIL